MPRLHRVAFVPISGKVRNMDESFLKEVVLEQHWRSGVPRIFEIEYQQLELGHLFNGIPHAFPTKP